MEAIDERISRRSGTRPTTDFVISLARDTVSRKVEEAKAVEESINLAAEAEKLRAAEAMSEAEVTLIKERNSEDRRARRHGSPPRLIGGRLAARATATVKRQRRDDRAVGMGFSPRMHTFIIWLDVLLPHHADYVGDTCCNSQSMAPSAGVVDYR